MGVGVASSRRCSTLQAADPSFISTQSTGARGKVILGALQPGSAMSVEQAVSPLSSPAERGNSGATSLPPLPRVASPPPPPTHGLLSMDLPLFLRASNAPRSPPPHFPPPPPTHPPATGSLGSAPSSIATEAPPPSRMRPTCWRRAAECCRLR